MPKKKVEIEIISFIDIADRVVCFIRDIIEVDHTQKETLVVGPLTDAQITSVFEYVVSVVANNDFAILLGKLGFQCKNISVVFNNSSDLVKRRDNYIKLCDRYEIAANCHHLDVHEGTIKKLVTYYLK